MTQEYYSTGRRKFQHLTSEKRAQLEILLKVVPKIPKTQIAKMLGIARSTLYDELNRGSVEQLDTNLVKYKKYYADAGQRVYEEHRNNSRNPCKLAKVSEFIEYAENRILKHKESPDTVVGYAKKYSPFGDDIIAIISCRRTRTGRCPQSPDRRDSCTAVRPVRAVLPLLLLFWQCPALSRQQSVRWFFPRPVCKLSV